MKGDQGVTFNCPNCGVVFQIVPRIDTVSVRGAEVEVYFQTTSFSHRCDNGVAHD